MGQSRAEKGRDEKGIQRACDSPCGSVKGVTSKTGLSLGFISADSHQKGYRVRRKVCSLQRLKSALKIKVTLLVSARDKYEQWCLYPFPSPPSNLKSKVTSRAEE